jgi:hypothetical protein
VRQVDFEERHPGAPQPVRARVEAGRDDDDLPDTIVQGAARAVVDPLRPRVDKVDEAFYLFCLVCRRRFVRAVWRRDCVCRRLILLSQSGAGSNQNNTDNH